MADVQPCKPAVMPSKGANIKAVRCAAPGDVVSPGRGEGGYVVQPPARGHAVGLATPPHHASPKPSISALAIGPAPRVPLRQRSSLANAAGHAAEGSKRCVGVSAHPKEACIHRS